MYEIWLAANVLLELARMHWPWLLGLAVLWILLVAVRRALRGRETHHRLGLLALIWVAVTALAVLTVPAMTRSALSNVTYIVDWLNLLAIAAGVGAVITAFAWPLLGLVLGRRDAAY